MKMIEIKNPRQMLDDELIEYTGNNQMAYYERAKIELLRRILLKLNANAHFRDAKTNELLEHERQL